MGQVETLLKAAAHQPGRRKWWGKLAEFYHAEGNDLVAVGLLKCALEQPATGGWHGAHAHDLLARCLWRLGRYEEGHKHMLKAVTLESKSQRLRENLKHFERKLGIVPLTRIFITGCAKSGTTLLKRLFHAFKDVEIESGECHIVQFCQKDSKVKFLVGKRHRYSLFSEHLSPAQTESQLELVRKYDVRIVNIIRDGRDVVFSDHMNVSPRRWIAAMRQREEHDSLIDVEVRYEDVVANPDSVQERLAQALGLGINHRWSEYPDFVPEHEFAGGIYGKRPLDIASVGKGLPYRDLIDDIVSGFDLELEKAGYISCSYRKMDEFYQRRGPDVHSDRPRHETIAKLVEGPVVLDVGCGTGDLLLRLQQCNGLTLYGTDISQVALDMAKERGVRAVLHRCDELPLLDCNTIVMSQLLEHVDDDVALVRQAARQLVPDGLLVVTVPKDDEVRSPEHKRNYSEESLRELLGEVGKPTLHSWPGEQYRLLMTVRKS